MARRVPNGATYRDKALLHSVPEPSGCWTWFGSVSQGIPRVRRAVDDTSGKKGPVNLRVAILEEAGPRPESAYNATPSCGVTACVNPDHLQWETREAFFARQIPTANQQQRWTDDEIAEAWQWHIEGTPATECARRLGISRSRLYLRWDALRDRRAAARETATPAS